MKKILPTLHSLWPRKMITDRMQAHRKLDCVFTAVVMYHLL